MSRFLFKEPKSSSGQGDVGHWHLEAWVFLVVFGREMSLP
jgi:hypothetical protein